jgi:hypothetical protein
MLRAYKERPNFWGGLRSIHSPLLSVCPLGNIARQQDHQLFKLVAAASAATRVWDNVGAIQGGSMRARRR